ncbi:MAG TPA: hypothetical protein VKE72_07810 [Methylocella sp.]|nr:hypothetical protein [Methylocella sp.]
MILEHDLVTKKLLDHLVPRWTELRVRKRHFSRVAIDLLKVSSILFVGKPSLLCCTDSKDFRGNLWEYFPISLEEVDEKKYAPEEWLTIARKGGTTDLDRKLQWLFEMPSLSLTEGVESFTDWPPKPDSKETSFCFYNGLEVKDPQGRGGVRITASDQPDFIVTLRFTF